MLCPVMGIEACGLIPKDTRNDCDKRVIELVTDFLQSGKKMKTYANVCKCCKKKENPDKIYKNKTFEILKTNDETFFS